MVRNTRSHAPRRRRRRHGDGSHEAHTSHERWLVTYADMLTLLLVLFVVLYAMSIVDTTKFQQLRAGLAAVFDPGQNAVVSQQGGITSTDDGGSQAEQDITPDLAPKSASKSVLDQQVAQRLQAMQRTQAQQQAKDVQREVDEFREIEKAIEQALAKRGMTGAVQFSIDERGLVITIVTNSVVFGGNSADLRPGGQRILDVVTPPLLRVDNPVEVDGHTNQQQVSTYPYPSGWELSSARASSVVRYLIAKFDFPKSRLSAVGFSDQRPLYPPSDPRSISRNRRVDMVVLSKLPATERSLLPSIGNEPVR